MLVGRVARGDDDQRAAAVREDQRHELVGALADVGTVGRVGQVGVVAVVLFEELHRLQAVAHVRFRVEFFGREADRVRVVVVGGVGGVGCSGDGEGVEVEGWEERGRRGGVDVRDGEGGGEDGGRGNEC